jgi:hypothetical protein
MAGLFRFAAALIELPSGGFVSAKGWRCRKARQKCPYKAKYGWNDPHWTYDEAMYPNVQSN